MATNKEIYIQYCHQNEEKLPLFFKPIWLDTVCARGKWDVFIAPESTEDQQAFLIYYTTSKYGQQIITMPPLTPFSGLVLDNKIIQKDINATKWESKVLEQLIQQLPKKTTYYNQNMYYTYQNWLPFYWDGFQQTTRYSYVIENLSTWTLEVAAGNVRNQISKAGKSLTISETEDVKLIYKLVDSVLRSKNIHMNFDLEMLEKLDNKLKNIDSRRIYLATDNVGNVHAAIYIVYDQNSAYYLLLGSDPTYRNSGAVSFLLHHAIMEASKKVKSFDFEGSMLESVNGLFSGFGGTRKPYLRIFKTKNWMWDIIYRLKSRNDKSNR